jgi:hypothetical protein
MPEEARMCEAVIAAATPLRLMIAETMRRFGRPENGKVQRVPPLGTPRAPCQAFGRNYQDRGMLAFNPVSSDPACDCLFDNAILTENEPGICLGPDCCSL